VEGILTLRLEILTVLLALTRTALKDPIHTAPRGKMLLVLRDRKAMEFLKGTPMDHLATASDLQILMLGNLDTLLCATVVLLGLLLAPFLPIRSSGGRLRDRCRQRKTCTAECSMAPLTIALRIAVATTRWRPTVSLPWVVARGVACLLVLILWNRTVMLSERCPQYGISRIVSYSDAGPRIRGVQLRPLKIVIAGSRARRDPRDLVPTVETEIEVVPSLRLRLHFLRLP